MKHILHYFIGIIMISILAFACASPGRLEGGPVDVTPPVLLKSSPKMGALNVNKQKVVLTFDEYIKLDKPGEKVVISPPQEQRPEVKADEKKVIVKFEDSLKANTTYTINFSDAIEDNNEGNPLENFIFCFSTGKVLDTLQVSGTILNAHDLEPVKGCIAGLHANLADSAFTKLPFDRVGVTDSKGRFTVLGIAKGNYRVYGLKDGDQNYKFSQITEPIAFQDSTISPYGKSASRMDTVFMDSITIDTIIPVKYTKYYPDNIILRLFTENKNEQRLAKSERSLPQMFTLYFTADADTLPHIKGLNFNADNAFIIDRVTGRNDTVNYWIKDTLTCRMDTLKMQVSYMKTDSLHHLVPQIDTLALSSKVKWVGLQSKVMQKDSLATIANDTLPSISNKEEVVKEKGKKKTKKKKKKEEDEKPEVKYLPTDVYAPSSMDVYDYITLTFKEPVASVDTMAIKLEQKVDTLWHQIKYDFVQDSVDIKKYNIYVDWKPGDTYRLTVDSAAIKGLYGLTNNKISNEFTVKKLDSYGQIFFNITNQGPKAFVELLDMQDQPVRAVTVENGKADFYYLNPGKYCARLVNDTNGNGVWDTGNFKEKREPEMVYYYPQIIELKANFDLTQSWDVTAKPLDQQKPNELKKQKPDEKKKKNRDNRGRLSGNDYMRPGYMY